MRLNLSWYQVKQLRDSGKTYTFQPTPEIGAEVTVVCEDIEVKAKVAQKGTFDTRLDYALLELNHATKT